MARSHWIWASDTSRTQGSCVCVCVFSHDATYVASWSTADPQDGPHPCHRKPSTGLDSCFSPSPLPPRLSVIPHRAPGSEIGVSFLFSLSFFSLSYRALHNLIFGLGTSLLLSHSACWALLYVSFSGSLCFSGCLSSSVLPGPEGSCHGGLWADQTLESPLTFTFLPSSPPISGYPKTSI